MNYLVFQLETVGLVPRLGTQSFPDLRIRKLLLLLLLPCFIIEIKLEKRTLLFYLIGWKWSNTLSNLAVTTGPEWEVSCVMSMEVAIMSARHSASSTSSTPFDSCTYIVTSYSWSSRDQRLLGSSTNGGDHIFAILSLLNPFIGIPSHLLGTD